MGMQIFQDQESLQWARDVHEVPEWAQCIILHGNEDWPEKIECFRDANPSFDDVPNLVVYPKGD
jgi:hypothetical protein